MHELGDLPGSVRLGLRFLLEDLVCSAEDIKQELLAAYLTLDGLIKAADEAQKLRDLQDRVRHDCLLRPPLLQRANS